MEENFSFGAFGEMGVLGISIAALENETAALLATMILGYKLGGAAQCIGRCLPVCVEWR